MDQHAVQGEGVVVVIILCVLLLGSVIDYHTIGKTAENSACSDLSLKWLNF